jgi:sugar/nucleoside kinase (ribokinase family)
VRMASARSLTRSTIRCTSTWEVTGCGDVWGATCFVALVRGQPLASALAAANRAAARNAEHRGADGLHTFLMEAT